MHELILRNARMEDSLVDIGVTNGKIADISPKISGTGQTEINAEGCMVSSPFIESHVHLDTTLTAGEPKWNESGTLFEGIETWALRKKALTHEDVVNRASTLLKWQAAQGVLHVRSHVDVTDPDMTALKALLEVREKFKGLVNVQIVAFPQEGILSYPNGTELLEEALKMGADAVGAIPHYELTRDMGAESIKIVFKLAEKYNKLIDIHCDETDDPESRFLEIVVAEAIRTGMGKLVTASHTTAFGSYDNAYAFKLMSFIKKSQINFVSNPLVNITLQGRLDTYPKRRGVTRVKELWQNGINVSFGYDDIMDSWYSMGTGNMLQPAHMGVHVCQMTGRSQVMACYDMITKNAARTLNIEENYGIEKGKPADFIILDAKDKWEAIRRLAAVTLVVKNGQVIAETNPQKTKLLGETINFSK